MKYVDFKIGEDSGYIRFDDPKAAVDARAFAVLENEGGLLVKNHIVTLEALTGNFFFLHHLGTNLMLLY